MENIKITSHQFTKQNNITISRGRKSYDIYKCQCCGLEGKRYGLTEEITVVRNKVSCSFYKNKLAKDKEDYDNSTKVKITDRYPCISFGLEYGAIYDRVECPEEEKEKFANDIWVYSEKRKEPIRLLEGEYKIISPLSEI